LAAELLKDYEPEIKSISLIPGDSGKFEVDVNGKLIYSKEKTGRHAESGEVNLLLKKVIEKK